MSSIQEKLNQLAATAGSANWADRLRKGDADAKAKLDARIAEEYRKMAERTGMSLSPHEGLKILHPDPTRKDFGD